MNAVIQFDLFLPPPSEIDMLRMDIKVMDESMHKQRKALFARNGALTKRMLELEDRLEIIERNICKE